MRILFFTASVLFLLAIKVFITTKTTMIGPDGVGDYKVSVKDQFYVGHGAMSTEATSNATYLCRAPTVGQ